MRTFYDILGVNNNATQEEITIAYRKTEDDFYNFISPDFQ